ncbi:MAG TPA: DHH family phosphoesterase [Candidatus Saccharimonadales bacterium]|nr:DHH family phosphoesterase [Candidatus Saccharimonadales bacterium]
MNEMQENLVKVKQIIDSASSIVIIQADNPDADSLGSALAIEQILGSLGKNTSLYCGVDMPSYLRYMKGWDRVAKELPKSFDASIIVDASTMTLLEKISASGEVSWLATKPCIVLDHHEIVENPVYFSQVTINDGTISSTGELIYMIAKDLDWDINHSGLEFIMSSILGDTQGLSNSLATSQTYRVMAEMIDNGVSRPEIEEMRRELSKMPQSIYRYKADLINKTEFDDSGRVAIVVVGQEEISTFSPLYNPAPLIQADLLQVEAVEVAIVLKSYDSGKVTGAIRTNPSTPVAAMLADHFGGGGHKNASGFKIEHCHDFSKLKSDVLSTALKLITELKNESI